MNTNPSAVRTEATRHCSRHDRHPSPCILLSHRVLFFHVFSPCTELDGLDACLPRPSVSSLVSIAVPHSDLHLNKRTYTHARAPYSQSSAQPAGHLLILHHLCSSLHHHHSSHILPLPLPPPLSAVAAAAAASALTTPHCTLSTLSARSSSRELLPLFCPAQVYLQALKIPSCRCLSRLLLFARSFCPESALAAAP